MKFTALIGGFTLLLVFQSKQNSPKFIVSISNYFESPGYEYTYTITNDSLRINFNCDWVNCSDTIVYRIGLDRIRTAKYHSFVKALKLENLESIYQKKGADGLTTVVSVSGDSLFTKDIILIRYRQLVIKRLIDTTNSLIPENSRKIKYY